jgi:RibD C-terminal domain
MAKSVLYTSMSLDGFITGPDDGPGNGLGTGANRLHEWLGEPDSRPPHFDPQGSSGQVCHWDGDHHRASLAQSLLRTGLLDELEIHLVPVVLGAGRRLFGADRIELEPTRVLDAPGVTHARYSVAA